MLKLFDLPERDLKVWSTNSGRGLLPSSNWIKAYYMIRVYCLTIASVWVPRFIMIKFPSRATDLCTVARCKMVLAFGYGELASISSKQNNIIREIWDENVVTFRSRSLKRALFVSNFLRLILCKLKSLLLPRGSLHPHRSKHALCQDVVEHEDQGGRGQLPHALPPWDQRLGLGQRTALLPHPLVVQVIIWRERKKLFSIQFNSGCTWYDLKINFFNSTQFWLHRSWLGNKLF